MYKSLNCILLTGLLAFSTPVLADSKPAEKALEVGIVPYLSARVLITNFEPMRAYLENTLGRPVKIYTSTGFKQFFQNAQRGDYDLVFTAAHFARLLQKENQYTPLARFSALNSALVVAGTHATLKTEQDLKGKVLAIPDELSLSSISVLSHLRESGLQPGVDFKVIEVPSFSSAILSVQKGEADAAISAAAILTQMPKELADSVKTIFDAGKYYRMIILAHPHMKKSYAEQIRQALFKFSADDTSGKQFLINTSAGSIVPATPDDMSSLDRYLAETRRILSENP